MRGTDGPHGGRTEGRRGTQSGREQRRPADRVEPFLFRPVPPPAPSTWRRPDRPGPSFYIDAARVAPDREAGEREVPARAARPRRPEPDRGGWTADG